MSIRHVLSLLAIPAALASLAESARGQEPPLSLAGQFQQICGTTEKAGPTLPGEDVAAADAPGFFAGDLRRATDSRVVKIGDRYAMRALVPSSADPQHAVFLKCAVAGSTSFGEEVDRLSAMLSAKPDLGKTGQDFEYARFDAGMTGFLVYSEPEGWVAIYKMDILMRNIDPKYLKKGAKPAPAPSVQ
jgi:hypothetical protein